MKDVKKIAVMFVCTGNICRSPTAEAVFRACVEDAGLGHLFDIQSSGTHGYHIGMPPDPRTIDVARAHGIDMGHLKASQIKSQDLADYHYVFAMDTGHYEHLQAFKARGDGVVRLFLDRQQSVPDPYYGPLKGFEEVFALIEGRCRGLLCEIRSEHGL